MFDDIQVGHDFEALPFSIPTPTLSNPTDAVNTIRILEHNLSALYTTAKLEIAQKDAEIQRLRTLVSNERVASALQQEAMRIFLRRVQGRVEALKTLEAPKGSPFLKSLEALTHLVTVGFSPDDVALAGQDDEGIERSSRPVASSTSDKSSREVPGPHRPGPGGRGPHPPGPERTECPGALALRRPDP